MKKVFTTLSFMLFLCFGTVANAQNVKLYASPQGAMVLDPSSPKDSLLNPWCGGWLNPQISSIDLNGDGRMDLFVFEPGISGSSSFGDNRVLTFLNIGNGQYQYYPEYESYFPPLQQWAILVDYNKDGKPDIFTFSQNGGGMDVYENISAGRGAPLKFKKVSGDILDYTDQGNYRVNIFAQPNGIPAIGDADGDGDIDIISFDPTFYTAWYYKNQAVEKGESLDSLDYVNPTECWGDFHTTYNYTVDSTVLLHIGCGTSINKNAHGASTMLLVDMDNDGDQDMLYGNLFNKFIVQLTNGRIENGKNKSTKDTIVTADSALIGDGTKVNMNLFPAAYLADGTGDNLNDLIVAPMDYISDTINHKTWLYENTGSAPGNHFKFVTNNFLQNTMVDEGEHSAPAFVDYNGDGLMDLVIATRANPDSGYMYFAHAYDHLILYKNIGTVDKAVYEKVDDDFGSLKKYRIPLLAPTFADLDGDGRPDMFLGTKSGKVMYFKNEADSGETVRMKLVSDSLPNIHANANTTPCLAHISNDSLYDLVMGCDSGTISYYKNTGTKASPAFKLVTHNFGKIRTNETFWEYTQYDSKGRPIDSMLYTFASGGTAPIITDLDHNGKLDLITGSTQGEMFCYFNITDNLSGAFTRTDTIFYNTLLQKKENKLLGSYTMPAAADLNNDNLPELLIGNYMGGTMYYGSKIVKLGVNNNISPVAFGSEFKIFPNPAKGTVSLSYTNPAGPQQVTVNITDLLGQTVISYPFMMEPGAGRQQLATQNLTPGIYIVNVTTGDQYFSGQKLIISR